MGITKAVAALRSRPAEIAVALAAFSGVANAQPALELKGFHIGQQLVDCPPETSSRTMHRDGQVLCGMLGQTFANERAAAMVVGLLDGKVSLVSVSLVQRGFTANAHARRALVERWGEPQEARQHLNWAKWRRGTLSLLFDGYKGLIMLVDEEAQGARNNDEAKKSKSDT